MWFAGIDWADEHHDVCVLDETGQRLGKRRVAHSAAGIEELLGFLLAPTGERRDLPREQIACIVETTQGLLITALLEAGFAVYPINPKTLEHWRGPAGAKTDAIDAYLLARKGRSELDQLRRLEPDAPLVQELKLLTRDQDTLVHLQTRMVNQLTACLKAYYPCALTLFAKLPRGVAAQPSPSCAATPRWNRQRLRRKRSCAPSCARCHTFRTRWPKRMRWWRVYMSRNSGQTL